jgi:hypothetical protein
MTHVIQCFKLNTIEMIDFKKFHCLWWAIRINVDINRYFRDLIKQKFLSLMTRFIFMQFLQFDQLSSKSLVVECDIHFDIYVEMFLNLCERHVHVDNIEWKRIDWLKRIYVNIEIFKSIHIDVYITQWCAWKSVDH